MELSDRRSQDFQIQEPRRPAVRWSDWLGRIRETTTDMKLDRNVNPDGRGKYALINLRTNKVEWGGEGGQQFFVLKYKDKFAAPALRAYAKAVMAEAVSLIVHANTYWGNPECAEAAAERQQGRELAEFAGEVEREAVQAERSGVSIPSALRPNAKLIDRPVGASDSLAESVAKRDAWEARSAKARKLLEDLGGAANWKDAKLEWDNDDEY